MRIRPVAIATIVMGNRRLEVSAAMAREAGDLQMFALQRISCFGVIKLREKGRALPSDGVVT